MPKIYYDPDEDELIPMKKGPQTKPSGEGAAASNKDMEERLERIEAELFRLSRSRERYSGSGTGSRYGRYHALSDGFDDDDDDDDYFYGDRMYDLASERNDTLREIADAVERNNRLLMMHEAADDVRHQQNRNSAITAAGAVIGWKVMDGLCNSFVDVLKSFNPFDSSCCCKKKKWF